MDNKHLVQLYTLTIINFLLVSIIIFVLLTGTSVSFLSNNRTIERDVNNSGDFAEITDLPMVVEPEDTKVENVVSVDSSGQEVILRSDN